MRKYGFLEKNFFYISKNIVNEITLSAGIRQIRDSFYIKNVKIMFFFIAQKE